MATKYPVQSDVEIKISSIGGDLKIEGSSEAEIRARGDDPQVEVVEDGHSAEIMCNGDCVLSVPDGAQITVDVIGADAALRDLSHEISIEQVGADLSARDLHGLRVTTVVSAKRRATMVVRAMELSDVMLNKPKLCVSPVVSNLRKFGTPIRTAARLQYRSGYSLRVDAGCRQVITPSGIIQPVGLFLAPDLEGIP